MEGVSLKRVHLNFRLNEKDAASRSRRRTFQQRRDSRCKGPVVGKQHSVFKEHKGNSRTGMECTQERQNDVVRAPGSTGPVRLASILEVCVLI